MNSRSVLFTLCAASAIALTGCDWGSSRENTWNDSYAWANFTGTYRFTKAIVTVDTSSSSSSEGSSSESETEEKKAAGNGTMTTSSSASGQVSPVGLGLVPTKFTMTIGTHTISDKGGDGDLYEGSSKVGSVAYSSGKWDITTYIGVPSGTPIKITYWYNVKKGGGGSGGGGGSSSSNAIPLSYLNVVQKGNKVTMSGDSGIVYSGQLTGASMGSDGYVAAQTVYLSFSVASANGDKITGSFSGVWSGAAEKTYGNLTERQIRGTLSNGTTFAGTAADVTISVPNVEVSE